jgi:hypothetical protein
MDTAMGPTCTSVEWRTGNAVGAIGRARLAVGRLLHVSGSTTFGNVVIVMFFVSQALDGALTYVGVRVFGPTVEGNPLLAWLMASVGEAPALAGAKLTAIGLGMILHLASVHRAVAVLTALYVTAALLPWMLLLLLAGHLR